MPKTASAQIAVIGIDIGKNSFHVVGHDSRGAIILRQKWSCGQIEARLRISRLAWSAWRRVLARIILPASSLRLATTRG